LTHPSIPLTAHAAGLPGNYTEIVRRDTGKAVDFVRHSA
jgi:hypothetical protein